jgi:thiol-disulfide isomerase/thioredoxin
LAIFHCEEADVHRGFLHCGVAGLLALFLISGCLKPTQDNASSNTTQPATDTAAMETDSADAEPATAASPPEAITLEVVDIDGYRKAIEKHRGKVVFVDFWATWCPPCMENFPHTVHISRAFPKDQVAVISVSFDELEDKEKALAFLEKHEARFENFITVYGAGTEGTEAFEIKSGVPHYEIYDREGNVATTLAPGPDLKITLELLDAEIRKVSGG